MYYILVLAIILGTVLIVAPEKLYFFCLLTLIGGVFRIVTLFEYYIKVLQTGIRKSEIETGKEEDNKEEVNQEQGP